MHSENTVSICGYIELSVSRLLGMFSHSSSPDNKASRKKLHGVNGNVYVIKNGK